MSKKKTGNIPSRPRDPDALGMPIPTKFYGDEETAMEILAKDTKLSTSEIIRRGFRLMARRVMETGSTDFIKHIDRLHPYEEEEAPDLKSLGRVSYSAAENAKKKARK